MLFYYRKKDKCDLWSFGEDCTWEGLYLKEMEEVTL